MISVPTNPQRPAAESALALRVQKKGNSLFGVETPWHNSATLTMRMCILVSDYSEVNIKLLVVWPWCRAVRRLQSALMTATVRLIVREVAEKRGVSNPFALANATGLNYAICYRLWNGNQRRIDLKTLARLCKALDVRPGQLFDYHPNP
jgi:DNA-binding Xre family transcriptional regulator